MGRSLSVKSLVGPASPALGNQTAFSLVQWFRSPDNSGGSDFVSIFNEGSSGFPHNHLLQLKQSGAINVFYRNVDSETITITSVAGFDDDVWHWIHWVKRASNDYQLYIDGTSEGTDTTTVDPVPSLTAFQLGATNTGVSGSMLGSLWGFRTALTIEQARSVAFTGRCGVAPEFFLPLGLAPGITSADSDPDLSGGATDYSVSPDGSDIAFVDSPPIGPLFGYDLGWQGAFTGVAPTGRIMSSLAYHGGLAGAGGIAGKGGGLAA